MNALLSLLFLAPLVNDASVAVAATDWPSWRGPLLTGSAVGADPPVRWSEEENVAWKSVLPGHGKSTPIVVGQRIFLLAADPSREATPEERAERAAPSGRGAAPPDRLMRFLVVALDRATGRVVWESEVAERLPIAGTHETNGYASSSPVTDGDGLYLSFGTYGVYALDAEDGEVRWSYELGPQKMRNGFGEGASPALSGDTLVVVADQEESSFIVALDTRTGEPRWRRERDEASTWTTPLVVENGGKRQAIINGRTAVRSYDLATGELLWHCDGQTSNPIPTPVPEDDFVIVTSGFRGAACLALSLDGRGDLRERASAILWSHDRGTPYVPSPLLVDGRLYLLNGNTGVLSCLDAQTGEVLVDRERLDLGNVYASPLAAGGRIYVVDRDGRTVVLQHGEKLGVLATNAVDEGIDATPVAVGRALFLRADSHLYAIGQP
jgi:outer membrane protein assembly factor BamB